MNISSSPNEGKKAYIGSCFACCGEHNRQMVVGKGYAKILYHGYSLDNHYFCCTHNLICLYLVCFSGLDNDNNLKNKDRFMTSLKDLSREFVRNTVAAIMSLMVMAIIWQQKIISDKDTTIAEMSINAEKRERELAIEKVNEVREQVNIYKRRLEEIEAALKKNKRK